MCIQFMLVRPHPWGGKGLSRDIWTPEIFGPPMHTLKTNPAIQTLETIPANHSYPEPSPWPFWICYNWYHVWGSIYFRNIRAGSKYFEIIHVYGLGGTKKGVGVQICCDRSGDFGVQCGEICAGQFESYYHNFSIVANSRNILSAITLLYTVIADQSGQSLTTTMSTCIPASFSLLGIRL